MIAFQKIVTEILGMAQDSESMEETLKKICDRYNLSQYNENCCDPVSGAQQNSITSLLNRLHPEGGLSFDADEAEIRICQHPDAGHFDISIAYGWKSLTPAQLARHAFAEAAFWDAAAERGIVPHVQVSTVVPRKK